METKNYYISNICANNYIDKVNSILIKNIERIRMQILSKQLKEKMNIDFDFEKEKKLKRFSIEYNGNEETVFFNDGETKKRIVTFVHFEEPIDFNNEKLSLNFKCHYY